MISILAYVALSVSCCPTPRFKHQKRRCWGRGFFQQRHQRQRGVIHPPACGSSAIRPGIAKQQSTAASPSRLASGQNAGSITFQFPGMGTDGRILKKKFCGTVIYGHTGATHHSILFLIQAPGQRLPTVYRTVTAIKASRTVQAPSNIHSESMVE